MGLERVRLLEVARSERDGCLWIALETTDEVVACGGCGAWAENKERPKVELADLPAFGSPVRLVWHKRRWCCPEAGCEVGSWTEQRADIAPSRVLLTARAGQWATREVGQQVHTVAYVAGQLQVAWHTVMDAVAYWAQPLIEDPERAAAPSGLGVDETKFLAAGPGRATVWAAPVCDLDRNTVIEVVETTHDPAEAGSRGAPEIGAWLDSQPAAWREQVKVTVTDLHAPFRNALAARLPNAVAVADPFHVVGVANRALDRVRRRVQNATLGHRGRRGDPLYGARKLLRLGAERLDPTATTKLTDLLKAGDPQGEVYHAWAVKEGVRDLYTLWDRPDDAARWFDAITADCRDAAAPETRGLGRTLRQWRKPILAWHTTGLSNGPVEGLNSLIKKIKKVAHGFRNFTNYRLRILLTTGGCNWDLLGTPPR